MNTSIIKYAFVGMMLAVLASSCDIKLDEAYQAHVEISNQSDQSVNFSVEAYKSEFSNHQCEPRLAELGIEVPGRSAVAAARRGSVGVRLHCRMPPNRLAKIYQKTDLKVASAVVDNKMISIYDPKENNPNHNKLVGKTLSVQNADGSYSQDIKVVNYHTIVMDNAADYPWLDLSSAPRGEDGQTKKGTIGGDKGIIGHAWVMDLHNGTSLLQVVLGEKKLEIASEETLTIGLKDLSTADTDSAESIFHSLKINDERGVIVSPIPFQRTERVNLRCTPEGCNSVLRL